MLETQHSGTVDSHVTDDSQLVLWTRTDLNIPSVSRHSGCWRNWIVAIMIGGTVQCWLSMIHSKVTPNC